MDAFETFLSRFSGTIYGSEMRFNLYSCFELLRVKIEYYTEKIQEIESKIKKLEGGD